jgi:hypothetical protein
LLNNLITEWQFLPSAAELTNGFPCRNIYEIVDHPYLHPITKAEILKNYRLKLEEKETKN